MEYILFIFSAFVSFILNKGKSQPPSTIHKILVVKLDHIGDVVTSTPVFEKLKKKYPQAYITALVGEWAKDILENNPYIDNIVIYNSKRYAKTRSNVLPFIKRKKFLRSLFNDDYDLIVGLRDDWMTVFTALFTSGVFRMDRGTTRIKRKKEARLNPSKRNATTGQYHEVETNLAIIGILDANYDDVKVAMYPTDVEEQWLSDFLSKYLENETDSYIVIHPGAVWEFRRWSVERFTTIIDKLIEQYHFTVFVIGTNPEKFLVDKLIKGVTQNNKVFSLVGILNLRQSAVLIKHAKFIIGNDSGPVHIAAAVGIPVIALFGPQDPDRFRPWGKKVMVLHHPVECFPCAQIKCVRPDNPCINLITVDEVLSAVNKIMLNE